MNKPIHYGHLFIEREKRAMRATSRSFKAKIVAMTADDPHVSAVWYRLSDITERVACNLRERRGLPQPGAPL